MENESIWWLFWLQFDVVNNVADTMKVTLTAAYVKPIISFETGHEGRLSSYNAKSSFNSIKNSLKIFKNKKETHA